MNRIPRKFDHIIIEELVQCNAGNTGDRFIITKDNGNYHGTNLRTETEWQFPVAHLRNDNFFKIIEIA